MSSTVKPIVCVSATVEERVEPDIARLTIWFRGHGQNQDECAMLYAADARRAKEALEPFDLHNQLRLSSYHSYESQRRSKRASRGLEYGARGLLRIRPIEHDVVNIWSALAGSKINASIEVLFSLEDGDSEEAKLLGHAVAKARSNADALATAAGKRLGEVRQIRYNRSGDGFSRGGYRCSKDLRNSDDSSSIPDFNPEPIEVTCSVEVDWSLE